MVRADDVVARLGGDEFIVLQAGIAEETEAELLARRIIRDISKPYVVDGISMSISVSVGIATAPKLGLELERSEEHTSELQSLMRHSYAVFCLKKKTHTSSHK